MICAGEIENLCGTYESAQEAKSDAANVG